MKTLATTTYLKLGAVVAALSAVAASGGYIKVYSDETLKREVKPLESSLDRLRRLS
jgi:hypothetical protein